VGRRDGKRPFGDHFDDPDLDGNIILKWIFKKCCGGMD
jgi:hypothetical protein